MKKFPFAQYNDDGSIEVFGNKGGYPRMSGVVPSPDINTKSEEDREQNFRIACDQITLQGYLITAKKRIRNGAFDRPDQKTSLSVKYRACKNETEIKTVYERIKEILKLKGAPIL